MLEHNSFSDGNHYNVMNSEGDRRGPPESQAPASTTHHHGDPATVTISDTRRFNDTRKNRGYPTDHQSRRRDDGGYPISSSRSRSASCNHDSGYYGPGSDRHGNRSRDEVANGDGRYSRSKSYGGPPRTPFHKDTSTSRDFQPRRARSLSRGNICGRPAIPNFQKTRFHPALSISRSPGRFFQPAAESEQPREWPPCFDQDGSVFVFDSRSSMFYESQSDFFYDPKSKLYYGNKKGAYFRYEETQDPPFVSVHKMAPAQDGATTESMEPSVTLPAVADSSQNIAKPAIAVKLKTKKVSKVQKQQVADIEKWTEKQTELKADAGPLDATSTTTTSKIDKIRVAVPAPKIKKTAKGEPICAICKRKFLTVEKLGLHERVSELHRKNLAKLAEESSAKRKQAPPASAEYRDRAQKRRDLHTHLPDAGLGVAALAKANHAPPQRPTGTPVGESLESTIGNKMLQKMGWEYGSSLGSKARDSDQTGKTAEATTQNNLRKDWERIEAMAGGALAHRPG